MTNVLTIRFPAWEAVSGAQEPWPRGWYTAPSAIRLRCVFDGEHIEPGLRLWSTGREGEVYCAKHAHYVS
jgi:hypothetical protein